MKVLITEEFLVRSIQEEFHFLYPHLKLEFFRQPHHPYDGSPLTDRVHPDTPIDEIRDIHCAAWIDMGAQITATGLEQQFAHLLGLSAQVFRKSGSIWLQTTDTDDRTLGDLEAAGRFQAPAANIPDIDLNEQT
ncbi:hypothetical protein [uncultured Chitinophaga sp.]|uniref:hypothetical protein n=1 Tax=uncultured Chitinophaga sp. TaxID=339340 RepID=UPI00261BB04E|nr:hypothetical protein [uncultured Chitinophaga sp.]